MPRHRKFAVLMNGVRREERFTFQADADCLDHIAYIQSRMQNDPSCGGSVSASRAVRAAISMYALHLSHQTGEYDGRSDRQESDQQQD